MPVCRECKKHFPNWAKINNETKNLSSRKFCLDCSPYNTHNTRSKITTSEKQCPKCKRTLLAEHFYKRKVGGLSGYCKKCLKRQKAESQKKLKQLCVTYAGGCCEHCGYDKYVGALEFHHKDPETKDFKICKMSSTLTKRIKNEIDKCLLLCANCHREEHARLKDIL